MDYQTEKHRGFAFVEYELQEDAQAAIDNMVSEERQGGDAHSARFPTPSFGAPAASNFP